MNRKHRFHVLFEDNHLLVVNKPALLPTMGVSADQSSLVKQAKRYLKSKYNKPGNVYLGVVSRLDAAVSGVMVLARTSKAADRLNRQFRARTVEKLYAAVVSGPGSLSAGSYTDWIRKNERLRAMELCDPSERGAQPAQLEVIPGRWLPPLQLVEIILGTGRKHQIRVQLAARGHPIVGDSKYGSSLKFSPGIALHSRAIAFRHPVRQVRLRFEAPWPASWRRRFHKLLGDDMDLER